MKVLIANSHIPWGGLGRFTINLARTLKDQACEVVGLVTHERSEQANEYQAILDDYHFVGGSSKLQKYFETARIINRVAPDVLLINHVGTVHFLLPFVRPKSVVSVIHSDQEDFYRIGSTFAGYVNAWVAPTPRVQHGFNAYTRGKFADRVFVIPHGVDTNVGDVQRIASTNGRLRVIFVGALYRHKGVDLLPAIVRQLRTRGVDTELTVLGDGELREWLQNELQQETACGTARIRGVVSPNEVRNELANADVLLFPTRVEAFGLVIAEAMAQGVVPVVSHLSGITDTIVEHQRTGYLVERDDVEGFCDSIELLHKDECRLCEMRKATRESAQRRYSLDVMGLAYRSLFKRLLEGAWVS